MIFNPKTPVFGLTLSAVSHRLSAKPNQNIK